MHTQSRARHLAACFFAVSSVVGSGFAQTQPQFLWGATPKTNYDTLSECSNLSLFVEPTGQTKPPFYLIAYEADGIPTIQSVGTNASNLTWTVDHPTGAQLIMTMVDAAGNSGGVSRSVVTVGPGTSSSCHATNPTSSISIITNTTKTLETCAVLPLTVSGGQKPYTISVAIINATTVANVSLGFYDGFNWVNRAPPGSRLIAVVSDATGQYSDATPILSTVGSTDTGCDGRPSTLVDSSGRLAASQSGTAVIAMATSSASTPTSDTAASSSRVTISTGIIIGVVAIGAVAVTALVGGLSFFLRRRRSRAKYPLGFAKLGGAPGQGDYSDLPVSEELAPFVIHAPPYTDHNQSQHMQDIHVQNQQHESWDTQSLRDSSSYISGVHSLPGPSGPEPRSLPSIPRPSTRTLNQYNDPSTELSFLPLMPNESTISLSLTSGMIANPRSSFSSDGMEETGGESSTVLAVAGPIVHQRNANTKGHGVMPQRATRSIYQHEDVADVEELPPAYKARGV